MKKLNLLVLFFVISSLYVHAWDRSDYWDYVGQVGDDIEVWFWPSTDPTKAKLEFRGSGDFYSSHLYGGDSHYWDWTYYDGSFLYTMDIKRYCDIVEFKDGIIRVPQTAFKGWRELDKVILPESVLLLEREAFMDCIELTEFTYYGLWIGQHAFRGCTNLETFTIDPKHGHVTIEEEAFTWCWVKKFTIYGDDVPSLDPNAFREARHDITLCVPREMLISYKYDREWGKFWRIESIEHQMTLEEYELNPNPTSGISYGVNWSLVDGVLRIGGVENIPTKSMYRTSIDLNSVTDLIIEEGVQRIESSVMEDMPFNNLHTIRLPESLNNLNYYSFGVCNKLKKLKLRSSIFFHSAFIWNTPALKEIWVTHRPSSMESPEYVFAHQDASTTLYVKDANDIYYYLSTPPWNKFSTIVPMENRGECGEIIDWEIGEESTLILEGRDRTYDYEDAQSVPWYSRKDIIRNMTVGDPSYPDRTITYLGKNVIGNCPKLKKIKLISETPPAVHSETFQNIDFNKVVLEVPTAALEAYRNAPGWKDFKNITSLILGQCGKNAFWQYKDSTLIISGTDSTYNYKEAGGNVPWLDYKSLIKSVIVEEGVSAIGEYCFANLPNLKFVSLPQSLTSLMYATFKDCTALPYVVLPDRLTFLGQLVFSGCTSLTDIVIPKNVSEFYYACFGNCHGLKSITLLSLNPPPWNHFVFSGVDTKNISVYVPKGCVEIYREAANGTYYQIGKQVWKDFGGIYEIGAETYILNGETYTLFDYGSTMQLPSTYTSDEVLTFTSTDTTVATVSSGGTITAIHKGVANIIISSHNGLSNIMFYVIVKGNNNASLQWLKINSDSLVINSDSITYTVPYYTTAAEIRASTQYSHAAILENPHGYELNDYYDLKTLNVGDNKFQITVKAEDETVKIYSINIIRTDEPRLKSLKVSGGTLNPSFSPDIYEYTVEIPNFKQITVTAEARYSSTRIEGTGTFPHTGESVFEIKTFANSYSPLTYRIHAVSTKAVVSSLQAIHDMDTLYTWHDSDYSHVLYVAHHVDNIRLNPKGPKNLTFKGTGEYLLNPGAKILSLIVIDEDGIKNTATVTVVRAKNSDVPLKALSAMAIDVSRGKVISEEAINLNFNPDIFNYKVLLPNTVDSIKINAILERSTSTVTGTSTRPLNVGDNIINIAVTSADSTVLIYTINARRVSTDATLKYLTISYGNEIHGFDVSKTHHTLNVENDVENIMLDFAPNYPSASFRPGDLYAKPGIKSPAVGNNSFYIGVLAEDGQTDALYTVNIYRLPAQSRASSTSLREVSGQLTTVYMQNQTLYVDSPSAEQITVCSVTGKLLYGLNKPSGKASFTVIYPGSLLIVRGSSGWVRKVGN